MGEGTEKSLVLVAEDNADIAKLIVQILERMGAEVVLVISAEAAIAFDRVPKLFITDLGLTDGENAGLRASEHFSKQNVPVMVVTGQTGVDQTELRRAGVFNTVFKPFSIQPFQNAVRPYLGRKA